MFKKIEAIIFDMDGVLINTPKYAWAANNEALKFFGAQIPEDNHYFYAGKSLKERIPLYEKNLGITIDFEIFSDIFIDTQLSLIEKDTQTTRNNIKNILGKLKEGKLLLALTTSARRRKTSSILKLLEIEHLFDFIITSDDIVLCKPNPGPYLKTMELLQTSPKNTLIIEDSPLGIKSGKSAGAYVVGLKTNSFSYRDLKDADTIISKLEQLTDLF